MRGLSFWGSAYRNGARVPLSTTQFAAQCGSCKESSTAKPRHAVSIYYPFALVELADIGETDEHEETGEVMLSFLDSDGCQVTLRLTQQALEQLCQRLEAFKK